MKKNLPGYFPEKHRHSHHKGAAGTKLVEIVLNRPIRKSFTYSLPRKMSGGRIIGCRVAVPFGSDNLVGYVWRFTDTPPDESVEIREILYRLDSTPILEGDVFRLVRWAVDYYHAPPGMMMAAAHPPGISGKAERVAELKGVPDPSHPLSKLLSRGTCVRVSVLEHALGEHFPLERELADLAEKGIIEVYWKAVGEPKPVTETVVEPALNERELIRLADAMKTRAPRRAEIIMQLVSRNGPVEKKTLLKAAGASGRSLEPLVRNGLLRLSARRKHREARTTGGVLGGESVDVLLNGAQEAAVSAVTRSMSEHAVHLLHGVTGSGKTEVYVRLIRKVLEAGKSALIMVPEISLTPQTASRFSRRFPGMVAVLHSGMTQGERLDTWNLVKSGKKRIVVGPRSTVFAPLEKLGLIVVDEEHDDSYKQNELPLYNGRDLAVLRGKMAGIPVVLGSASPSMESYGNAVSGKYRLLELRERVDGIPMPVTRVVEQDRRNIVSRKLLDALAARKEKGEQSIVLVNRRGFSPAQVCGNCGYRKECPDCGITLTYHRKGHVLKCHHCSFWEAASDRCPRCGFDEFTHMGPGIQKVEEFLQKHVEGIRVIRMDSDTTRGKDAHWRKLSEFAKGGGDVLLGTQMVAKGHDFPNVTLAGIVAADMGLAMPDFRAAERTFQLILQVAGRSGRGSVPGEVIIQAYDVSNPVIRAAADHDYESFWSMEKKARKAFCYPPFGHLVRLVWSGMRRDRVEAAARKTMKNLEWKNVRSTPPVEAVFQRINKRWRWNVLLKSGSRKSLAEAAKAVGERFGELSPGGVRLEVDVDPRHLL